jgi:antitoxin StbD
LSFRIFISFIPPSQSSWHCRRPLPYSQTSPAPAQSAKDSAIPICTINESERASSHSLLEKRVASQIGSSFKNALEKVYYLVLYIIHNLGKKMQRLEASIAVSVSDLKKNPSSIVSGARGSTVAVLNHNRVIAYMVPSQTYEAMLDRLDDFDLAEIIKSRADEIGVPVQIDEL